MFSIQKITPCLWFDANGEEAMNFYISLFKNSKIVGIHRNREGGPGPVGSMLIGTFELDGVRFQALNGGPIFKFTEAISMSVDCESQEEVDFLWDKLIEGGGQPSRCGWLKDKYGLSWQIVPRQLKKMLEDKDAAKAKRAMDAMLKMGKIDVPTLQRAYDGV